MANNTPILKPDSKPVLDTYQQACVDCLTDALEEAIKGRISSLALVVCMDDGIAPVMAGKNPGALMLGLERIKQNILTEVFDGGNVAPRKSSIMRAR